MTATSHTLPTNRRTGMTDNLERIGDYRVLRPLRARGLPRELLTVHEGALEFRRLTTLRIAPAPQGPGAQPIADALMREASVLARLHHPTIVPAYDFFQQDGWRVLALAFEGVFTIDRVTRAMQRQPVRVDDAAAWHVAHRLFDALAHAHARVGNDDLPLVHGDVHPANLIVRRDGHVLVRGFRGAEPYNRALSTSAGGPFQDAYVAPEVRDGELSSPRSDVYGAAVIVWELLVGRPAGAADAFSSAAGVPSLAVARPDLPASVSAVLDMCLSPDPDARSATAEWVAKAIRREVDVHVGRDSLARLHARVLARLPASVRALCSGTLPPRLSDDSNAPTLRMRRPPELSSTDAPVPLIVGHPSHPLHGTAQSKGRDTARGTLPSPSTPWLVTLLNENADEDDTTITAERAPAPRDRLESDPDTLVRALETEPDAAVTEDDRVTTLIRPPARSSAPENTEGEIAPDTIRDAAPHLEELPAPHAAAPSAALLASSFPPVATSSYPEAFVETMRSRRARRTHLAAAALTLLVAPALWFAGRLAVQAFSEPALPAAAVARVPIAAMSIATPAHTTPPVVPLIAAEHASATPTREVLAEPVLFHQSAVLVEGPPNGTVYVNGVPTGETGKRLLTRGCGMRFVRIGTPPVHGSLHGVRWLTKGQTAHLPCGRMITLRAETK